MRFLLIVLGVVLLALGIYTVAYGPRDADQNGVLLVQSGSIFFAAGAATVDLVEAIKRRNSS